MQLPSYTLESPVTKSTPMKVAAVVRTSNWTNVNAEFLHFFYSFTFSSAGWKRSAVLKVCNFRAVRCGSWQGGNYSRRLGLGRRTIQIVLRSVGETTRIKPWLAGRTLVAAGKHGNSTRAKMIQRQFQNRHPRSRSIVQKLFKSRYEVGGTPCVLANVVPKEPMLTKPVR